ncbi:MAG: sugar phosphate nucleotidyltransferase, partial [Actinomycetota bacterium]
MSANWTEREARPRGAPWGIVLAGGEGVRLQPLTRWVVGDSRPKQFCSLTGPVTLLEDTVRRTALLIPRERQLLSLSRTHAPYYEPILDRCEGVRPVVQPENGGTALGVLYPALHVAKADPSGTVAVFPSDHFIAPTDRFLEAVADAVAVVERHPHTVVLLGVLPSSPEPEYGWIEPGERIAPGAVVRRVIRFVEKPPLDIAREMLRRGWLWNTLVVVAKVSHLVRLALTHCPETVGPLLLARDALGGPAETAVVARAYAQARPANFSRDLLEPAHEALSVLELAGVTWSDLGTPRRVIATLVQLGAHPAWMTAQL